MSGCSHQANNVIVLCRGKRCKHADTATPGCCLCILVWAEAAIKAHIACSQISAGSRNADPLPTEPLDDLLGVPDCQIPWRSCCIFKSEVLSQADKSLNGNKWLTHRFRSSFWSPVMNGSAAMAQSTPPLPTKTLPIRLRRDPQVPHKQLPQRLLRPHAHPGRHGLEGQHGL